MSDANILARIGMSKEWAGVFLAIAGILVGSIILIAGKLLQVNLTPEAYIVFLGFEVAGVVLGLLMRKSIGGKAGLAASLCLLAISVLAV